MSAVAEPSQEQIDSYLAKRSDLITQDRAQRPVYRSDDSRHYAEADRALKELRAADLRDIFSDQGAVLGVDERNDLEHVHPGMGFLRSKDKIAKSELFAALRGMPKGAVLHAHLDGMADPDWFLAEATNFPELHLSLTELYPSQTALLAFQAFPEGFKATPLEEAFDPASHKPENWYNYAEFVADSTTRNERLTFLKSKMSLTVPDIGHLSCSSAIWKKFQTTFGATDGLARYAPLFKKHLRHVIEGLVADGVSYMEVRANFLMRFMRRAGSCKEDVNHFEWYEMFEEVVESIKAELKEQGREGDFVGAKVVYTTIRFVSNDVVRWYMEDCIELKKRFPHLIAGFDLVGHEDELEPYINYLPSLLWFQSRCQEEGVDIPFVFHAGETLGDGTKADMNLYDAILLGTKRIGHGFSMIKHPELMKTCREKGIAIEVCPISNEILGLSSSIHSHPLSSLMAHGVPVVISNDDPQMFGNTDGLSWDFYQVLLGSEVNSIETLGALARASITHSLMESTDKERALASWELKWGKWVQQVAALAK